MGKCNMCGLCCKALSLGYSMSYAVERIKEVRVGTDLHAHYTFVIEHLEEQTHEQAFATNPYLEEEYKRRGGRPENIQKFHFYRCKMLSENNLCTIHDHKPQMCSGYPWYGRPGGSKKDLFSDKCGYMDETDEVRGVDKYGTDVKEDIQAQDTTSTYKANKDDVETTQEVPLHVE